MSVAKGVAGRSGSILRQLGNDGLILLLHTYWRTVVCSVVD